jgi:hypothetical protein
MQGKLAEEKPLSADAWARKAGGHDITSARILFVRLATALLESEPAAHYVGQLKTLLTGGTTEAGGNVTTTWDIGSLLVSLRPRLSPPDADLLETLAAALNDRARVADLDRYPAWRDGSAVPLDAAWPAS